MKLDVVYVTYNSEKWIEPCFASWKGKAGNCDVNIIVVDNASTDNTLKLLEDVRQKMSGYFGSFQIIRLDRNVGFGGANNVGFRQGTAEIVCFFNIDTEILDTTMDVLSRCLEEAEDDIGAWELRQIPYEHPKVYNPVTRETDWCSGAAFAVRRKVFEEVKGFEECFFMYAEDVDLSWRIRQHGYCIRYCPEALICHKSYAVKGEIKFTQYAYGMRNNLLMRLRYGNLKDIVQGYVLFAKMLIKNRMGADFNRRFLTVMNSHWKLLPYIWRSRDKTNLKPYFYGLDYAETRQGAFYEYRPLRKQVKIVAFILDAEGGCLAETMQCIKRQTVPAAEVYCVPGRKEIEIIAEKMGQGTWFSIIETPFRMYADHFETMAGAVTEEAEVVGTVDGSGQLPDDIGHYIFSDDFYKKYKDRNLDELCKRKAVRIEKQTVC